MQSNLEHASHRHRFGWQVAAALVLAGLVAAGFWSATPLRARALTPVDAEISNVDPRPGSFADVIAAVQPAVVNISTSTVRTVSQDGSAFPGAGAPSIEEFFRRFGMPSPQMQAPPADSVVREAGSGFIVSSDGFVVTNHHVTDGAKEIVVTLDDGARYDAKLIGSDPKTDLTVLKIERDAPFPFARFGNSDSMRSGDWVIAIGNPFGLGGTATVGIVSARGRDIQSGPFDDYLQIDAPINQGNSGGPLFDTNGTVIGVNTAIYSPNGGNVGIGFAIPASLANPIVDALSRNGRVDRGWLGVEVQGIDDDMATGLGMERTYGALVARVVPGSPADHSGIVSGDVIVAVDGHEVGELRDLTRPIASAAPNERVHIDVMRGGKIKPLDVVVGRQDADLEQQSQAGAPGDEATDSQAVLGLELRDITKETRERLGIAIDVQGAVITAVDPTGSAASKGIRPGDVVTMVGQTPVAKAADAKAEIQRHLGERDSVLLQIARGDVRRFISVRKSKG